MVSRIKKNDTVVVLSGKDKGKQGEVIAIDRKNDLVKVRGIAIATKHQKPRSAQEKGKIVKEEAFIHACKVMPVCPETNKGCRVRSVVNEQGKRVRVSHRSQAAF